MARALTSCIGAAAFDAEAARPYIAEAVALARELGDRWRLSQILAWQASMACLAGNPVSTAAVGEEGQSLADAVGDRFTSRTCRFWGVGTARFQRGELAEAVPVLRDLLAEADAAADVYHGFCARIGLAHAMLQLGQITEARTLAREAVEAASGLGPFMELWALAPLAQTAIAAGDFAEAAEATDAAWQRVMSEPELAIANVTPTVELALLRGELTSARQLADDAFAPMRVGTGRRR